MKDDDNGMFSVLRTRELHLYGPQGYEGELYKERQRILKAKRDSEVTQVTLKPDGVDESPGFLIGGALDAMFGKPKDKQE